MDTQRLILFFVFSFSLLLLWEAWQKETRPPQPAPASTAAPAAPTGVTAPSAAKAGGAQKAESVPGGAVAPEAKPAEQLTVRTDTVIARVSTQGGDIVYLELLQHRSTLDNTKNLILFGDEHHYAAQSGLTGGLPFHRTVFAASAKEFSLPPGKDTLDVRLEARTPEGVRVTKVLTFH